MIGFRSNTPWKKIIAICYYSLCFAGFKFGVEEGIASLIIAANIPFVVSAVVGSVKLNRKSYLYAIPVYIVVASLAVFTVYKVNNKEVVTTTENAVVTTDLQNNPIDDMVVYVTRDGDKYHKQDCSSIKNSNVFTVTLRQAEENSKVKCQKCFD